MEKNFKNALDRQKNECISFGGSETQEVIGSNNPSSKATLLRPCNENKWVNGTGHHAWTSRGLQETRTTTAALG